jgi:hypothetical protein
MPVFDAVHNFMSSVKKIVKNNRGFVIFDAASVLMSGIMIAWNVLLFILKATLIAGLVLLVTAPDSWLGNFLLGIISAVTKIVADFVSKVQLEVLKLILNAIVDTVELFPVIVVSDVVRIVSASFAAIALSLITGFFVYQAIKNAFSHLGFDGEPTFNTLIMYVIVIILLLFTNPILSTFLQMTYDITMIFISQISNFGDSLGASFSGITSWGSVTSGNNLITIGTNVLLVVMLAKIIRASIDIGFTVVQRMIVISILIIIGPLAISFGVLKSMRSIMSTWMKSMFITNFVFIIYSVMLFFVANSADSIISSIDQSSSGDYVNVIKLFVLAGLIMSITKAEDLVVNIFMGQPTVGGPGGSVGVGMLGASTLNPMGNLNSAQNGIYGIKNWKDERARKQMAQNRKDLMGGIDHLRPK